MAVKGLTDLITRDGIPAYQLMPKIATVRKGDPKGESRFPRELDYFRIDLEPSYAKYQDVVDRLYGEQPKEINNIIILPDQDVENLAWMEAYDGTHTIKTRCDGEVIHKNWNKDRNAYDTAKRPCLRGENDECPLGCKLRGNLAVSLRDFYVETGEYGYFRFLTGGKTDVTQWMGAILSARHIFRDIGDIYFTARRIPEAQAQVTKDGRALVKHYNVKFLPDKKYGQLALQAKEATDALLRSTLPALSAVAGAEALSAEDVSAARAKLGTGNGERRMGTVKKDDEPGSETIEAEIIAEENPATKDWREDMVARDKISAVLKAAQLSAEYALEHLIPDTKFKKFSDLPIEVYPTVEDVIVAIKALKAPKEKEKKS